MKEEVLIVKCIGTILVSYRLRFEILGLARKTPGLAAVLVVGSLFEICFRSGWPAIWHLFELI
jgi:hypothetical protein